MAHDINLTSQKWIDIIFEGKNKSYGAYVLRQESSKRHLIALLVTLVLASLTFIFATIAKQVNNNLQKNKMTTIVETGNYKLDKPVEPEKMKPIEIEKPQVDAAKSIQFQVPRIKKDELVEEKDVVKSQSEVFDDPLALVSTIDNQKGRTDGLGVDPRDLQLNVQIAGKSEPETDAPFDIVEINPTFPGGTSEMYAFLNKNIVYPAVAAENNIQGTVVCQFIVAKDGTIEDVKVVRGKDPSLDKEAIRVIKSMPKWIPGKQGGNAVKVRFTLPVAFKLQN